VHLVRGCAEDRVNWSYAAAYVPLLVSKSRCAARRATSRFCLSARVPSAVSLPTSAWLSSFSNCSMTWSMVTASLGGATAPAAFSGSAGAPSAAGVLGSVTAARSFLMACSG
jgi:hypothetical protein